MRRRGLFRLAVALILAFLAAAPALGHEKPEEAVQGAAASAGPEAPTGPTGAQPAEGETLPGPGEQVPQPRGLARFEARIVEMAVFENDDQLHASCTLEGAFVPRVRDQIASGLEVSFLYRVELVRKHTWLVDKALAKRKVVTRVAHHPTTGRYHLTRFVDDVVTDSDVTEDEEEMIAWMTRLEGIPLIPSAELPAEGKIVLRARAKVHDDFVLWFIPWDFETGWGRLIVRRGKIPEAEEAPAEAVTEPVAEPEG